MTIGDVFAVIASVVAICVSGWALFMGMALLFESRSKQAGSLVRRAPWRSLGVGVAIALTVGLVSVVLLYQPLPALKLLGWIGLMALVALASLGASGVAQTIAIRIQNIESGLSGFHALARGAAILVGAGLVPIFGWFVFGPLVLLISIGAGMQALFVSGNEPAQVKLEAS